MSLILGTPSHVNVDGARTLSPSAERPECRPDLVDEQTRGPFRSWRHEHLFTEVEDAPAATLMRDVIDFSAPAGPVGTLVATTVLRPYLTRLIERRNRYLAA